ncbi:MAG TPA: ABC transporter substrate-binding protein [Xanthobacteraceae bacterium]|nr:ABC transporter substrate-binding protein [Xanthobacteraceae bacterium]
MLRGKMVMLAAGLAVGLAVPASAQTEIKLIGFGGGTNVPSWVAIDKGFFLKEGLKVTQDVTHGSKEQMQDIMAGKYQFASTAFDNIVAYTEGQGTDKFADYDVVAIAGVHSGMNTLVARPEIKKYSDLKGKVVAVDSPTSGYATVLYQIVKDKAGLEKDKDYTTLSVGGTGARVKSLKDGTGHVAMISSPNDMQLKDEGFTILGDAATEIGEFQGSAYAVRKSYAKDHPKEVEAFLRGIVAATDYVFSDKAGTVEVLKSRIKGLSDADAGKLYDRLTGPGGLNKRATLNTKGIETVLKLRTLYGGAAPTKPEKYIDLSFYEKVAGKK